MNKNAKMIKAQNKETNLVAGEIYNGPLPHPDILKGFQEVNSEYPDRIFKMAEEYSASNIRIQERITKANIVIPILGQVFTFLIVIIGMGAGIFFALKGYSAASITSIIGGFAPILISAIQNMKQK